MPAQPSALLAAMSPGYTTPEERAHGRTPAIPNPGHLPCHLTPRSYLPVYYRLWSVRTENGGKVQYASCMATQGRTMCAS